MSFTLNKSFFRKLISGLKNLDKIVNNHQVLSGLVIALIISGWVSYVWTDEVKKLISSTASKIWTYLTSEKTVDGWFLFLMQLLVIAAGYVLFREYKRRKAKNAQPDYLQYTSDEFHGFKWRWHWQYSFDVHKGSTHICVLDDVQVCPKCSGNMRRNHIGRDREYNCSLLECSYLFKSPDPFNANDPQGDIADRVARKIRTGEYKDVLRQLKVLEKYKATIEYK